MKRTIGFFALLAACTCGARGAAVAEGLPAGVDTLPKQYDLNEVVVTATRTPLPIKETPVLTRVIPAREIEKSGLKNIQEVLESELAGVEFHQAGYGESITFQGLDARYLLFLVDGERVAGETYGNVDYGRIPLNNIERIEIVRGASSVLYGSNAMGAVVNVVTKKPEKPVRIVASGRYGGLHQTNTESAGSRELDTKLDIPNINADLYAGFRFGQLSAQTTLSYLGSDGYMLFSEKAETRRYNELNNLLGGGTLTNITYEAPRDTLGLSISAQRSFHATQRLDYSIDTQWSVYALGAYSRKSMFGFPSSQNNAGAEETYTWESYNSYNLQGGAEFRPNENHRLTLSYNGDLYFRGMDSLQYLVPKQMHSVQVPRLLWTGRLGAYNRLTSGLEYTGEKLNYDLGQAGYDQRRDQHTVSFYLQDELNTRTPLSFTAGIRVDHNDRFGGNFTPKVSAKYGADYCSLRINYSEGYRNPSLKELYMNFTIPTGTATIVGNPDLEPEYNRYLSVSAEYLNGTSHVAISGYTSWFRDKIDVLEVTEGRRTSLVYHNVDKSRFSGIEVVARARIFSGFFAMANYNYVHQMESGNTASQQYIYPSPHTATLKLDYHFACARRDFGVHLQGRYIGEKAYSVAYSAPIRLPEHPGGLFMGAYTATHEAYSLWNLTVSARMTPRLTLQAGVNNLLDYRAPVINFNSCMSAGRNGFAKMVFTFE